MDHKKYIFLVLIFAFVYSNSNAEEKKSARQGEIDTLDCLNTLKNMTQEQDCKDHLKNEELYSGWDSPNSSMAAKFSCRKIKTNSKRFDCLAFVAEKNFPGMVAQYCGEFASENDIFECLKTIEGGCFDFSAPHTCRKDEKSLECLKTIKNLRFPKRGLHRVCHGEKGDNLISCFKRLGKDDSAHCDKRGAETFFKSIDKREGKATAALPCDSIRDLHFKSTPTENKK